MSETAVAEVDLDAQETWEATTGGTTYISIKDPRNPRAWVRKKVSGRGSRRITLTVDERLYNEQAVAYDGEHNCPFRNGLLRRISPKGEGRFEVTDEELVALLQGGSDEEFQQLIENTESEVVLRRMQFLGERNATMYRVNALRDLVELRYPNGKTSRVYQEYLDDLRAQGGTTL